MAVCAERGPGAHCLAHVFDLVCTCAVGDGRLPLNLYADQRQHPFCAFVRCYAFVWSDPDGGQHSHMPRRGRHSVNLHLVRARTPDTSCVSCVLVCKVGITLGLGSINVLSCCSGEQRRDRSRVLAGAQLELFAAAPVETLATASAQGGVGITLEHHSLSSCAT